MRVMTYVRYSAVGLLTLLVYLAAGEVTRDLELGIGWRCSVPFMSAVAVNYMLQRGWVFRDPRPITATLRRYAVMIATGYSINLLVLFSFSQRMPLVVAQLAAVLLILLSNLLFSFCWVFAKPYD